jgi:uncharacterized protein
MIGDLDQTQIEHLLREQQIGRIGIAGEGRVYVFPIAYGYDGRFIYSVSHDGTKTRLMRGQPEVAFEVEAIESPAHWRTVLVHGTYEELTEESDRDHALATIGAQGQAPVPPSLAPYVKGGEATVVYRIRVREITGRFEHDQVISR